MAHVLAVVTALLTLSATVYAQAIDTAAASAYAAGATRFRRISVEDRQVIGGEAASFLVPAETYNDPVRGEPVELPSTHKHAWVSRGGEYILTDNPNFNPNVERRGDWVEMQPTP
jgi:hypothetical protein